jgi:DNA-binding NarL/FixJ family response regulator
MLATDPRASRRSYDSRERRREIQERLSVVRHHRTNHPSDPSRGSTIFSVAASAEQINDCKPESSFFTPHGVATRVLMLTTFDRDDYLYEAMKAGASGFLLKDARRDQLVHAIRTVATGEALLAPELVRRLVEDFCQRPPPGVGPPPALAELTGRELEVLRLVARGLSNAEVAKELFLSEATVKTHLSHVMQKLDLRDRVQAVVLAYESGLVRPGVED